MALNNASGWRRENGRVAIYYKGTRAGFVSALGLSPTPTTFNFTGALSLAATWVAGTGYIVTTGNQVVTAGDHRVTAGNVRLGVVSAFSTEPTSAYVMKAGTAAAGTITTSGGIMTDGTNVQKIIADGTVSNIQT